jgi:ElaB/YqjD/DUF883 family membrane-anchored ribosome-binding protein
MAPQDVSGTTGSMSEVARASGPLEDKGRELGRRADELGARVQSGLRHKAHELEDVGHQVHERVAAAKERVSQGVHHGRERVEQEVQSHPMRTLLWAFGAGAVLGLLLGRRSKR